MIQLEIERLLNFAINHNLITEDDKIQMRNELMSVLRVSEPYSGVVEPDILKNPTSILSNILDYCARHQLIPDNSITQRDLMDAKIMGILTPRQSEVIRQFNENCKESIEKATDEFYALSQANNYIQTERIAKNLYWQSETDYGNLEITINLSKPEKDPKEIAKAKNAPQTSYPKCLLCVENVGYEGSLNHPARQNLRVIPLELTEEQWSFQYSPYVYYNEHCIILKNEHVPMKITEKTIKRLLQFVQKFPHYFIGSNADLPIVGGSILSHDHFQGGRHVFPMQLAIEEQLYKHEDYDDVNIVKLKWPMSVIRIKSVNIEQMLNLAMHIINSWREYTDEQANIYSYSADVPHNTVTPIARKNNNGEYELDLVLRNNKTSEQYPLGIYHPHQELHHIKKENIGLIEVMGLAVLPGRLNSELESIEKILSGEPVSITDELEKHNLWIEFLKEQYGVSNTIDNAKKIVQQEVGKKFMQVLLDAGVYKRNYEGQTSFDKYLSSIGINSLK